MAVVLIIGPGPHSRGGIDTVLRLLQSEERWKRNDSRWIETHDARGVLRKCWKAMKAAAEAAWWIRRAQIIHIHGAFRTSLLRKSIFILLAKLWRRPVIYHVHAFSLENLGCLDRWLARTVLERVDCVVALSPTCAQAIARDCTAKELRIIPNPVLIPATITALCQRTPHILYLGQLITRKGYSDLLRAFLKVAREMPSARLTLGGAGDTVRVRALATDMGLADRVEVTGWLDEAAKRRALEHATVFCLPSHDEASPVAVLEALSYALPVVATRVGGIPDIIEDGVSGVLVEPEDVPALETALLRVLTDKSWAQALGMRGRACMVRDHSVGVVWDKLEALYTSLRNAV